MADRPRRALMLVGHGSHINGDSAAPLFAHLRALRASGRFDEVVPAFWKEEPSLREAIRATAAHEIVVVPLFISDGYFTQQVVPRELGLASPEPNTLSIVDGRRVVYTAPVGTHPAMTAVLEARAREVVGQTPVDPATTALVIAGHGTPRNQNSAESIHAQVVELSRRGRYAEVAAIFMDEAPYINEVLDVSSAPDVIVVPYFIADGFHTQEDIPGELGIATDDGYPVPAHLDGRRLWYAGAVGTAEAVVEVILQRAADATALLDAAPVVEPVEPVARLAHRALASVARATPLDFGQIAIRSGADGGWTLTHSDDVARDDLECFEDPYVAESLARTADDGHYRPLSTAPTLRHGWRLRLEDDEGLRHALDGFYPATVVAWYDDRHGALDPTPWSETAGRQSGMYRVVRSASPDQVRAAVSRRCAPNHCLRRVAWSLAPDEPLGVTTGKGMIPCREACGLLIGDVRALVRVGSREE